jgi:hypothetical protein
MSNHITNQTTAGTKNPATAPNATLTPPAADLSSGVAVMLYDTSTLSSLVNAHSETPSAASEIEIDTVCESPLGLRPPSRFNSVLPRPSIAVTSENVPDAMFRV